MNKFFLDANIVVDLIQDRKPFNKDAAQVLLLATANKAELFISTLSIPIIHYLTKKHLEEKILREAIDNILKYINVIALDYEIIQKSLKSNHKDLEDAMQIFCAHRITDLDAIITRNLKDFSTSEITVLAPNEVGHFISKKNKYK